MDYLIEIIGSLILLILSWLGLQVRGMNQRLDDLEEKKLDKEVYHDLSTKIEKMTETLIEVKVELAKWHGRMESQDKIKRERF